MSTSDRRAPARLLLAALAAWAITAGVHHQAQATPRMSLANGTPCAGCHHTPSGGGGRTELGWSAMRHTGALTYGDLGFSSLHDVERNGWLDGAVTAGFDLRIQAARLGRPEIEDTPSGPETTYPDLTVFPMQLQPYLAVKPSSNVTLYGTYAPGRGTFRDGDLCDSPFPGMSCALVWGMLKSDDGAHFLRAGLIQPTIGIRHDDHTLLIRGDARNRRVPIIPPNYGEAGLEAGTQPLRWLRAEAGVFHTRNLDAALNSAGHTTDLWPVSTSLRLTVLPQLVFGGGPTAPATGGDGFDDFDDFDAAPASAPAEPWVLNTWLGTSGLLSGDFLMVNGFLGLGILQGVSLLAEVAYSQRTIDYETLSAFVGAHYALKEWVVFGVRAERGTTTHAEGKDTVWQYVGGVEFFPLPYIEIRPEYRLVETDEYRFGQATVQVHLFY